MKARKIVIVSPESLQTMLDNDNQKYVQLVIGKALVALLNRQTASEQMTATTQVYNNEGFTGADARSGTLTAKSWIKNGELAEWQIEKWTKRNKRGRSRLTKYHRQLNEVAVEKSASK